MNEEITIPPGILGTRKLAAALATMILRKRGLLNTVPRRIRKGRWDEDEYRRALELRAKGKNYAEIGAVPRRTRVSVHSKLFERRAA